LTKTNSLLEFSQVEVALAYEQRLRDTRSRGELAAEFLPKFGISTECSLGRHPPEQLRAVLTAWQRYTTSREPALVS
jgi:hypothetical protein